MQLTPLEIAMVEFYKQNPKETDDLPVQARQELARLLYAYEQNANNLTIREIIEVIEDDVRQQVLVMEQIKPGSSAEVGIPQTSAQRIAHLQRLADRYSENGHELFFVQIGRVVINHALYIDLLIEEQSASNPTIR